MERMSLLRFKDGHLKVAATRDGCRVKTRHLYGKRAAVLRDGARGTLVRGRGRQRHLVSHSHSNLQVKAGSPLIRHDFRRGHPLRVLHWVGLGCSFSRYKFFVQRRVI